MPAIANVNDYIVGTIKIDGETTGWVERYGLNTVDYTAARTIMTNLATRRARLLARRHAINKVSVSRVSTLRDWLPASGYTANPVIIGAEMDNPEEANTSGVGLLFRFDCGDGKYSNRLLRGVRDTWITRNRVTLATPTLYGVGGPYLTYVAPADALDLLGDYLAYVRDQTLHFTKNTSPVVSYTPRTYVEWAYRRVAKHDEGLRIGSSRGRQSTMA